MCWDPTGPRFKRVVGCLGDWLPGCLADLLACKQLGAGGLTGHALTPPSNMHHSTTLNPRQGDVGNCGGRGHKAAQPGHRCCRPTAAGGRQQRRQAAAAARGGGHTAEWQRCRGGWRQQRQRQGRFEASGGLAQAQDGSAGAIWQRWQGCGGRGQRQNEEAEAVSGALPSLMCSPDVPVALLNLSCMC